MDRSPLTVDASLEALTSSIHAVLGDELVGLYLYGSHVSGGFDPGVSDLDLLAVTSAEVGGIDLAGLDRMHRDFVGRHPEWSDRLEVVYVGRATLQSFRTSLGSLAVISPGEPFHVRADRVADWVQNWYLVRETGVTLFGPDAAVIIPPIAWAEFVAATVRYADEMGTRRRVAAGGGALAYTILTMCRAQRTIETGTQGSKQEGAAWVQERMPEWAWLIDAALRCRLSRGTVGFDDGRTRAAAESFVEVLAANISRSSAPRSPSSTPQD